jgi:hypothetical protein
MGGPKVFKAEVKKPAIKHGKKLKPIPWTRLLTLPKEAPDRPDMIWDKVDEAKLDMDEIIDLFEIKVKNK